MDRKLVEGTGAGRQGKRNANREQLLRRWPQLGVFVQTLGPEIFQLGRAVFGVLDVGDTLCGDQEDRLGALWAPKKSITLNGGKSM